MAYGTTIREAFEAKPPATAKEAACLQKLQHEYKAEIATLIAPHLIVEARKLPQMADF